MSSQHREMFRTRSQQSYIRSEEDFVAEADFALLQYSSERDKKSCTRETESALQTDNAMSEEFLNISDTELNSCMEYSCPTRGDSLRNISADSFCVMPADRPITEKTDCDSSHSFEDFSAQLTDDRATKCTDTNLIKRADNFFISNTGSVTGFDNIGSALFKSVENKNDNVSCTVGFPDDNETARYQSDDSEHPKIWYRSSWYRPCNSFESNFTYQKYLSTATLELQQSPQQLIPEISKGKSLDPFREISADTVTMEYCTDENSSELVLYSADKPRFCTYLTFSLKIDHITSVKKLDQGKSSPFSSNCIEQQSPLTSTEPQDTQGSGQVNEHDSLIHTSESNGGGLLITSHDSPQLQVAQKTHDPAAYSTGQEYLFTHVDSDNKPLRNFSKSDYMKAQGPISLTADEYKLNTRESVTKPVTENQLRHQLASTESDNRCQLRSQGSSVASGKGAHLDLEDVSVIHTKGYLLNPAESRNTEFQKSAATSTESYKSDPHESPSTALNVDSPICDKTTSVSDDNLVCQTVPAHQSLSTTYEEDYYLLDEMYKADQEDVFNLDASQKKIDQEELYSFDSNKEKLDEEKLYSLGSDQEKTDKGKQESKEKDESKSCLDMTQLNSCMKESCNLDRDKGGTSNEIPHNLNVKHEIIDAAKLCGLNINQERTDKSDSCNLEFNPNRGPTFEDPFEVNEYGKIVPNQYYRQRLLHTDSVDSEESRKIKTSRRQRLKEKLIPILRNMSENLSYAPVELDLARMMEFTIESVLSNGDKEHNTHSQKASPACQRKESNLRQAESLDNVFDRCDVEQANNGLAVRGHPSVSIAKSLPHINQLSDYEDDLDQSNNHLHSNGVLPSNGVVLNDARLNNRSSPYADAGFTPKISHSKRINNKKKKTNLRRRHATREKDGRSKSLTQIDNLFDSSGDMLLIGSHGGEDGGGGDEERRGERGDGARGLRDTSHQHKLGIPDEHTSRRALLSSEHRVSSGEFITVLVDCGKEQYEDVLLATRGLTLREALDNRGIDVNGIDVYQEGVRSPLPLHTDTSQLGGKCVHIRARDDSRSPVRYRTAQVQRKSPGGRFIWGGTSTEEYSPLVDERANGGQGSQEGSLKASKSNKANNRWSLFQSNSKDSKMDELAKQLNLYSRSGIPKLTHLLACQSMGDDDELKLEGGWRNLVTSSTTMSEREEKQQSAIWELIETEATYISMLKVITDLFLACLCNLQNEGILNEIDTGQLFNNIQDIYQANRSFWRFYILPLLQETRRTRQILNPLMLMDGFCKFEEIFQPYTAYCLEQSSSQMYCKFHARENNYFKAYLAWCETQKECNRLKLVDILVQPMQRLTRYSILLKAIQKKTEDLDHKNCLHEMINHVDRFVSTVNSALRNRHEHERLKEIIKKIESYEAVESRDDELAAAIRTHSDLNLLLPMPGCPPQIPRWLLCEGDFRFRDAQTSKIDVHVFVFTDFLLITKITQRKTDKVKVIRPPFRIDRLVVVELKDSTTVGLIHLTDWGVAAAAFTLQSGDIRAHKAFLEGLSSARKQLSDARLCKGVPSYDNEEEGFVHVPRSPRLGSSRASRVSSLAHSHSGSMDLNETPSYASPGGQHPPSVDLSDIRASSASSEDSSTGCQAEIQRSKSLEGHQPSCSPNRQDRRLAFPKTPNTLSVNPPYPTGQSLPNLSSDPSNSLKVPGSKQLSPSNRGISYPPPSPRTLRRCPPVPQSRNPPLMKTRHVCQPLESVETERAPEVDQDEGRRRISRVERLDNRRYHTAGAIDDIKKQDTKDSTIHKRLSLNYGQAPPPPPRGDIASSEDCGSRLLLKHKTSGKSVSCESVHSSSGVSSTSSLLRAEYEALENIDDDNELEERDSTVVDVPITDCTSLKLSPHISTTYICHDSDITLGVSASQYITQPLDDAHTIVENVEQPGVKIDVSERDSLGVSSVQITVNESLTKTASDSTPLASMLCSSSSFSSSSSSASSSSSSSSSASNSSSSLQAQAPKDDQMKEILLNDASVESSDV